MNDLSSADPPPFVVENTGAASPFLLIGDHAGVAVPEALGNRLLAWTLERRTATLVELPFADAPEPEAPTEAQLVRYHENNARLFSTPEYRDIALATLNAQRMMAEIEVSERDIEDAYASHRARYETPEKREVFQALMQNEAAAQAIAAASARSERIPRSRHDG